MSSNDLPSRMDLLLRQALSVVTDVQQLKVLTLFTQKLAGAAWQAWLGHREPKDNSQTHEFIVLGNALQIAEHQGLDLSQKRIACAFALCHDCFPIQRIMEQDQRLADEHEQALVAQEINQQRLQHMHGGADKARELLTNLASGPNPDCLAISPQEIERCCALIAIHDAWKLSPPQPIPSHDALALCCFEADVLWPLHPLGVQADLERALANGKEVELFLPQVWNDQAHQNQLTLKLARSGWSHLPEADFVHSHVLFRTQKGYSLYKMWSDFWHLDV